MAWAALAFWILLAVPGAVVGRRLRWIPRDSGPFGAVGDGYVISLAACLPVVWLGYGLRWSIATLGLWVAVWIAVGLGLALHGLYTKRQRPQAPATLPHNGARLQDGAPPGAAWMGRFTALACALLIAADLWLAMGAGGNVAGDARFHMARVRSLFDEGFNQWDPYVTGHLFTRVYHTNALHALLAACAWLTGQSPHASWIHGLVFAKLAIAAGTYGLSFCLTGRRSLAWASAAAGAVWVAPILFSLYPNRIAPGFVLALGLGHACALWQQTGRRHVVMLALVSAVLPAVHPLYGLFLLLVVLPSLGARALWCMAKSARSDARGGPAWLTAFALVAVLAAPHLLISKWHGDYTDTPPAPYPALVGPAPTGPPRAAEPERVASPLVQVGAYRTMPFGPWFDLTSDRWLLILGAMLGLRTRRRRAYLGLLALALTLSVFVYVPPVASALAALTGFDWILSRLAGLYAVLQWPALCGPLLWLLQHAERRGAVGHAVGVAVCVAALLAHAYRNGDDRGAYTRAHYLAQARGRAAEARIAELDALRRALGPRLQAGDTVLAGLDMPGNVTSVLPVRFVGVGRAGAPIPDWRRRMRDSWSLLNERHLDPRVRQQLLDHYGVNRILVRARGKAFVPRRLARWKKRLGVYGENAHTVGPWLVLDRK